MNIDIVLCLDTNYLLPAKVTICSICVNNKDADLTFHIITDPKSKDVVSSLSGETGRWNQKIQLYTIEPDMCEGLPFGRPDQPTHASIASYYRLFLASVLPDTVEKVLYFDCDMIVRHSLAPLWDMDISQYSILACDDMYDMDAAKYNTLHYYPSEGYFNAGFLLVNLKYWRENDAERMFLDYAQKHPERIIFHDQDVLNVVLKDSKYRLPFKYNVQDGYLYDTIHFLKWPYEGEYEEAIRNPHVIHYSIRFKPWHKDSNHPWRKEYLKYVALAGLDIKDFPARAERLSLYQRLRAVLVKLGFFSPLLQFRTGIELE